MSVQTLDRMAAPLPLEQEILATAMGLGVRNIQIGERFPYRKLVAVLGCEDENHMRRAEAGLRQLDIEVIRGADAFSLIVYLEQ